MSDERCGNCGKEWLTCLCRGSVSDLQLPDFTLTVVWVNDRIERIEVVHADGLREVFR